MADLPRDALIEKAYQQLGQGDQRLFDQTYQRRAKSTTTAYVLWFFLGWHYAYLDQWGMQVLYWFSFGGLGIWALVDLFRIGGLVDNANREIALQVLQHVKLHADPHPLAASIGSYPQAQSALNAAPPARVVNAFAANAALGYGYNQSPTVPNQLGITPHQRNTVQFLLLGDDGSRLALPPAPATLKVGRSSGDLMLSDASVSSNHALLSVSSAALEVTDLASTNGTSVNGQRLPSHRAVTVRVGDRLGFGAALFTVQSVP